MTRVSLPEPSIAVHITDEEKNSFIKCIQLCYESGFESGNRLENAAKGTKEEQFRRILRLFDTFINQTSLYDQRDTLVAFVDEVVSVSQRLRTPDKNDNSNSRTDAAALTTGKECDTPHTSYSCVRQATKKLSWILSRVAVEELAGTRAQKFFLSSIRKLLTGTLTAEDIEETIFEYINDVLEKAQKKVLVFFGDTQCITTTDHIERITSEEIELLALQVLTLVTPGTLYADVLYRHPLAVARYMNLCLKALSLELAARTKPSVLGKEEVIVAEKSFFQTHLTDTGLCSLVKALSGLIVQGTSISAFFFEELYNDHLATAILLKPHEAVSVLLSVLGCSQSSREAVTMCGHLVATFLIGFGHQDNTNGSGRVLRFTEHLLSDEQRSSVMTMGNGCLEVLSFEAVSETVERWWVSERRSTSFNKREHHDPRTRNKDTTLATGLPRLAILRGIVAQLDFGTPLGRIEPYEFEAALLKIHDTLTFYVVVDDPVCKLYAFQGLAVWMNQAPLWVETKQLKCDTLDNIVISLLPLAMKYLDAAFKALNTQCYKLFELLLSHCKTSASHHVTNSVCEILWHRRHIGKFQLLALENLTSHYGWEWLVKRQPRALGALFAAFGYRSTRAAALQFLLKLMHSWEPMRWRILDCAAWAAILELFPVSQDLSQLPNVVGSREGGIDLRNSIAEFFVPALAKHYPQLLAPFWKKIRINRGVSLELWFPCEASIVASARLSGRGHLVDNYNGTENTVFIITENGVSSGKEAVTNAESVEIAETALKCGVVHGDSRIRLNIITAVCESNETTANPSVKEWELACLIARWSLRGHTAEVRSRAVTSLKKFISRAFGAFRRYRLSSQPEAPMLRWDALKQLHDALMNSVDPTLPFDVTGPALDVLTHMYSLAETVVAQTSEKDTSFISFLYAPSIWNAFLLALASGWERQRCWSRRILFLFPSLPQYLHISSVVRSAIDLLNSPRQADYLGGAETLCVLLKLAMKTTCGRQMVDMLEESFETRRGLPDSPLQHFRKQEPSSTLQSFIQVTQVVETLKREIDNRLRLQHKVRTGDEALHSSMSTHGLFALINRILRDCLPSCKELFSLVNSPLSFETDRQSIYCSMKITELFKHVTEAQWSTTLTVLSVLSEGTDAVLVAQEFGGPSVTPTVPQAESVMGVDCRGHPIIVRPKVICSSTPTPTLACSEADAREEDACLLSSWITVKESAECIETLMDWIDLDILLVSGETVRRRLQNDPQLSPSSLTIKSEQISSKVPLGLDLRFFQRLTYQLLVVLLGIKHPAAMDRMAAALSAVARRMAMTHHSNFSQLPEWWIHKLVGFILLDSNEANCSLASPSIRSSNWDSSLDENSYAHVAPPLPPPLRRSFSLGHSFLALLGSDPSRHHTMDLVPKTLMLLLDALESTFVTASDNCGENTLSNDGSGVKVHCLNIITYIVRCGSLATPCARFLGRILALALRFIVSPDWAVRNAANLLFAATTERFTGNRWGTSGEEPAVEVLSVLSRKLHGEPSNPYGFFLCTGGPHREKQQVRSLSMWKTHSSALNAFSKAMLSLACFLQSYKARFLTDIIDLYPPVEELLIKMLSLSQQPELINALHFNGSASYTALISALLFLSQVRLNDCTAVIEAVRRCQKQAPCYYARLLAGRALVGALAGGTSTVDDNSVMEFPKGSPSVDQRSAGGSRSFDTCAGRLALLLQLNEYLPPTNTQKLQENTLHGLLASCLEFVSRPAYARRLITELLAAPDTPNTAHEIKRCFNWLVTILDRSTNLHARAPLSRAVALQIFEQFFIAGQDVADSFEGSTRAALDDCLGYWKTLCFNLCISQCPKVLQKRLQNFDRAPTREDFDTPGETLLPGYQLLLTTSVRIILLTCSERDRLPLLRALLTPLEEELLTSKDSALSSAGCSAVLRLTTLLSSQLYVPTTLLLVAPILESFRVTCHLLSENVRKQGSPSFLHQEVIATLRRSVDIAEEASTVLGLRLQHHVSSTAVLQTLLHSLKLSTRCISCLGNDLISPSASTFLALEVSETIDNIIEDLIKVILVAWDRGQRNPLIQKAVAKYGALVFKGCRTVSPKTFGKALILRLQTAVCKAITACTIPTSEATLRLSGLKAIQILGLTRHDNDLEVSFTCWTRVLLLLSDECPDIRERASVLMFDSLRKTDMIPFMTWNSFSLTEPQVPKHLELPELSALTRICDRATPNVVLAVGARYVCWTFPVAHLGKWIQSLLNGDSPELSLQRLRIETLVVPPSEDVGVTSPSVPPLSSVAPTYQNIRASVAFDEEASNVFNEDCVILQHLCENFLARLRIQQKEVEDSVTPLVSDASMPLASQIQLCVNFIGRSSCTNGSSLCQQVNVLQHVSHSLLIAPFLRVSLIRGLLHFQLAVLTQPERPFVDVPDPPKSVTKSLVHSPENFCEVAILIYQFLKAIQTQEEEHVGIHSWIRPYVKALSRYYKSS